MNFSKTFLNLLIFIQLRKLLGNFPFQKEHTEVLQVKKLKKLLIHSYEKFPFYREIMDANEFDPYRFSQLEEIKKLPVLDKVRYREFVESEYKKNPERYDKYYQDATSGSTGIPLKLYRSWSERAKLLARFMRSFFVNGYSIFDITFSLQSPRRMTSKDSILQKIGILKRMTCSFSRPVKELVEAFVSAQPDAFYGNLSNLVQMALFIENNNIKIKQPRFYFSASETMDDNSRILLQNVFGENLLNHYGTVEFSTIAFQESGKDFMHILHDSQYLEVLDENQEESLTGSAVITDLDIYSFPMIRYKVGDSIELDVVNDQRVIKKIIGREDDYFILKDGTKKSANFIGDVLAINSNIRQYKITQETHDLLKVQLVLKEGADKKEILSALQTRFNEVLGYQVELEGEFLPMIKQDPNGKLAKFTSNIK